MAASLEAAYHVSHHHAVKSIRGFLRNLRSLKLILHLLIIVTCALFWPGCGRRVEGIGRGSLPRSGECSRRIAFASNKDGPQSIYSMADDGSDVIRLSNPGCPPCPDEAPVWSPSGDRIAFTSLRDEVARQIFIVNSDGTGMTQITYGTEYHSGPDFSCDGRKIAFTFRDQVWVMDSDGGNPKPLTTIDDSPYGAANPRWSPDCLHIAYMADPFGARLGCGASSRTYSTLWVMDSDGGSKRPILCGGKALVFCISPFSWSCDGKSVLYSNWDAASKQRIYLVTIDDCTAPIVVTPSSVNAGDPSWSPSCDSFAFRCDLGDGFFKICTMSLKGTAMKILTPNFYALTPAMSPLACEQ